MYLRDTYLTIKGDQTLFVVQMHFSILVHYKSLIKRKYGAIIDKAICRKICF